MQLVDILRRRKSLAKLFGPVRICFAGVAPNNDRLTHLSQTDALLI